MSEKWPRYPLSEGLLKSVKALFSNPDEGLQYLGLDKRVVPGSWYRQPDGSQPPLERAKNLKAVLEKYLAQMAAESREYGNPKETERLRSEAVGILLALHEIWLNFPEIVEDDR